MLWLLAVTVSLLTWFLWWAWRKKQSLVAQFVQSRLLAQLTIGVSPLRQKVRLALIVFAVACAMLALARPQWGFDWEEAKQRGLDIVVAIDTSRSMLAEDVQPNRLARAKFAALDLMKEAKNDRLALIPFAGAAFLQCPLTLDEQAFRQSVEALEVGIIPVGGTALTEAIETALTAFKEGDNIKILVLFTDGEDHDSGALAAAEKAARFSPSASARLMANYCARRMKRVERATSRTNRATWSNRASTNPCCNRSPTQPAVSICRCAAPTP